MNQTSSQQYNYTYQIDFLDSLGEMINLDTLELDDVSENSESFQQMTFEDRIAFQVLQNRFIEVLPFIPIGERYISLVYNIDIFVTVAYALRFYLIIRAFKLKVFTFGSYFRGKSEQKMIDIYKQQNHGSFEGFDLFQMKRHFQKRPLSYLGFAYLFFVCIFTQLI